jgi:hypothetical protein
MGFSSMIFRYYNFYQVYFIFSKLTKNKINGVSEQWKYYRNVGSFSLKFKFFKKLIYIL